MFNKITFLKKGQVAVLACLLCSFPASHLPASATLPGKEKPQDWQVLFDGKNTDQWRGSNGDNFPSQGWAVEDGTLFLKHKGYGDIITRETYGSFELVFEFKLTYGANSGVKYFVESIKNNKTGKMDMNGPEYQIIDDYNHPAVKDHQHEKGATAALYEVYAATNKHLHPAGQWNEGRIIARGRHVEHWLNGVKVLSYERGSEDFRQRMAKTKFNVYDHYGELPEGHILLTDHSDMVYFRNIKIRRL